MDNKPKKPKRNAHKCALGLHKATGQWCKRHQGKVYYFGSDLEAALKRFAAEWPDIIAGRQRTTLDSIDVRGLCNQFLTAKRARVDVGELTLRSWGEYHRACEFAVDCFGATAAAELRAADFGKLRSILAKRFGPQTLGKYIVMVKTVFKWAFEGELLSSPPRYGNQFDGPPKRVLRLDRATKAPKMLTAADVRKLLDAADGQLRAMILLGINCGFGAKDCSDLQRPALLLRPGWVDFARPKTGIARRVPLWPETVAALEEVAKKRPDAKDEADAGCVFLTKYGHRWTRVIDKGNRPPMALDAVAYEFRKLKKRAGVRHASGPYVMRHIFQTIGDETKDHVAVASIMGHVDNSTAQHYREVISDERLQAVVDHVRKWLFGADAS